MSIVSPPDYVGNIMPMCQERRGEFKDMQYLDTNLVELHYYHAPGRDHLRLFRHPQGPHQGLRLLDYELDKYEPSELVKVDMLLNGDQVDALSFIAHREKAYPRARRLCEKLRDNIPRQLFESARPGRHRRQGHRPRDRPRHAQGRAGQVLRRRHHPEKEAAGEAERGQKEDAELGTVQIPTEAFMAVLKLDEE